MTQAVLPARAPTGPVDAGVSGTLRAIEENVGRAIRGKPGAVRLALTTLLARGHLLVEDVPGVGKTTLARALAKSLGGTFRRIQFTSDLLPSDIVGVTVYDQEARRFDFRPGPVFANVVLADEINRTTPRTQSSLLEAMSEGQVSVDGKTHHLDRPFLVIATQNPQEHFGTYPLPESQMDRFLMRIRLGYPSPDEEKRLLKTRGAGDPVDELEPVASADVIRALQDRVDAVRVDDSLADYAMAIVGETRRSPMLSLGVSTRGGIAWYRAAQAHALCDGRGFCVPDDFKALAVPALAHRAVLATQQDSLGRAREEAERVIGEILERVPVPT
jgi:MoxR-like ATPase